VTFFADDRLQLLGSHQIRRQDRQLLVNVASTETQHEIADIEGVADIAMHALEPRLVTRTAMTALHDLIDNRLPADSRNRRLACRINIRNRHAINLIEGAAKLAGLGFG